MQYDTLPFPLGETSDSLNRLGEAINTDLLGRIYRVPAREVPDGPTKAYMRRTGFPLCVVVLKNANVNETTLKGSRVLVRDLTAGISPMHQVTGYANALRTPHIVISDEFLGQGGVEFGKLFYGVIDGPVQLLTSATEADFNGDWAPGDWLISAASGADLDDDAAGRPSKVVIDGTSATTGGTTAMQNVFNRIGYTLEAADASDPADQGALKLVKACILY